MFDITDGFDKIISFESIEGYVLDGKWQDGIYTFEAIIYDEKRIAYPLSLYYDNNKWQLSGHEDLDIEVTNY